MTRVLRYPFEAITDDTDYLQVTIKEYPKPGLIPGDGYAINDDDSSSRGYNSPVQLAEDGVILLPMPININDRNQVGYGPDKLDTISGAIGNAGFEAMEGIGENLAKFGTDKPIDKKTKVSPGKYGISDLLDKNTYKKIEGSFEGITLQDVEKRILTSLAAQAASTIPGVNVTGTQLLARQSGAILNPNMTLLMNGPSLRSFNFQFKMTPRDDREAKQVKSIIRSFKRNMAPKTATGNLFLETPNVFELRYKKGTDTHPFLHRFKQSALTDISVNYTGENVYATYNDGTPISTIMTLNFTELAPIYQDDYGTNNDFDADRDGVGY